MVEIKYMETISVLPISICNLSYRTIVVTFKAKLTTSHRCWVFLDSIFICPPASVIFLQRQFRVSKHSRYSYCATANCKCFLYFVTVLFGTLRLVSRQLHLLVILVMSWVSLWHLTPGCLCLEPAMPQPSCGTSERECADRPSLAMSRTSTPYA